MGVVIFTPFAKQILSCHFKRVSNTTDPISLRLPPELHVRLQKAADQIEMPKHTLCQHAIKAAVLAIEEASGRLVLPLEFTVKNRPAPRTRTVKVK